MEDLVVSLPSELRDRLQAIADETGRALAETAALAVAEFVEHWETHLRDVGEISEEEARAVLRAANE